MAHQWFTVGKIVNTHGLRGELKVVPQTDFPDERFKPGSCLTIMNSDQSNSIEVEVISSRSHRNVYILKFKQWNDINEVEKYKGWLLKINESQRNSLPENEYYYNEIIGCSVVSEDGKDIGSITEILSPGANDVWVIQPRAGKTIYIPYIEEVVKQVDVKNKKVIIHVMEGLLS